MSNEQTVTARLVEDDERLHCLPRHFGRLMMPFERAVYVFAGSMCRGYFGGYWEYYELSNGGFYMAPRSEDTFRVACANSFSGELSADAMGIVTCLYALSHLSFARGVPAGIGEHFHLLRDFASSHTEASLIFAAID